MKKILFPFDFSDASLNAFRYALHLASRLDAEIVTLHVYDEISVHADYYDVILENYQVNELSEFESYKGEVPKLTAIAEEEVATHVQVKHVLQTGDAVDTIVEMTHDGDIICVVMGTTGATGMKKIFMGSVAEKVMNRAKCPVLAIPEAASYRPIRNVLFLSKFKPADLPILQQTQKVARLFDANISVLHVKPHHGEEEDKAIREFRTALPGSDIRFLVLTSNAIEDTINDFIEIDRTDVIVVPVQFKNFFQNLFVNSMSRHLAFHSKIPVLSIPTTIIK